MSKPLERQVQLLRGGHALDPRRSAEPTTAAWAHAQVSCLSRTLDSGLSCPFSYDGLRVRHGRAGDRALDGQIQILVSTQVERGRNAVDERLPNLTYELEMATG